MAHTADPARRQAFITGLRDLADCLAAHPDIPVPSHGEQILVHMNSTEEGGCYQVREAARILGVQPHDETRCGGHFYADKSFGPLALRVVSIPDTCMARHHALWSYAGAVSPEDPAYTP